MSQYNRRLSRSSTLHRLDKYIFYAKMDNVRNLVLLLKGISYAEKSICVLSNPGLKLSTLESKCLESSCFVPSSMFQIYHLKEMDITFQINPNILLDCLQIYGNHIALSSTSLLIYLKDISKLNLVLEENGIVTECILTTQIPYELLNIDFTSNTVQYHVIMHRESLRDIFADLDMTNQYLIIQYSSKDQKLRWYTEGILGTCHIDFNHNAELIDKVKQVSKKSEFLFRYKLSLLKCCTKALTIAFKVSLRINESGTLCFQFFNEVEGEKFGFIEFLCLSDMPM